ncbi:MAG: hypothetical protein IKK75_07975 [Clostridia bacterium]|nr:hypothetical protein [Clostridia bacterium]
MDKKKSLLNVSVSIGFKIITMVMSIVVRRMLIKACGNEVNGLNALYLNIISVLSMAELGVGSAISFCMYKPIVEGNEGQVSALYRLFQRLYTVIGAAILVMGLALTPFIHLLAKDYATLDINLYSTFFLMLISVVITYAFASNTALMNAYKNNYIATSISSGGIILQYVLQIVVLSTTGSFSHYLICRSVAALVQWGLSAMVTRRRHQPILQRREKLEPQIKTTLMRSIKAMFMHKVGSEVVAASGGIIISACIGVVALGQYTNYTLVLNSLVGILQLFFYSLTSVMGHLYAREDKAIVQKVCDGFHLLNFCLGMVFFLGYYAIIDDLVAVLFAPELVSARSIAFVISLNGFVNYMRMAVLMFRDATGTFYHDRWKPLVEGVVNTVLSIVLVRQFGVMGAICATILTCLLISHSVEPYMLYKKAFETSPALYFVRSIIFAGLFVAGMLMMEWFAVEGGSALSRILINGSISVAISAVMIAGALLCMRNQFSAAAGFLLKRRKH